MATADITDPSSLPLGSPPRVKKRPRSLLQATYFPSSTTRMIHNHKAAARRRSAASAAQEGERRPEEEKRLQAQQLLPGLPDHLSHLCLSRLPPRLLYSVCRPWRRFLYSSSIPPFPALYALLSTQSPAVGPMALEFQSFDPISSKWLPLPSPQPQPTFILRHPAYLSRHFPVQSVAVGNSLVILAATTCDGGLFVPALRRPLVFHAPAGRWHYGPSFRPAPRRWCAAGAMQGKLYVASGFTGPDYDAAVARAVHRWEVPSSSSSSSSSSSGAEQELCADRSGSCSEWEELAPLKDGRFSREPVNAVAARGKLYMVNEQGGWAREGAAYDPSTDQWEDMPPGMLLGWTGPAAVLSAEEEEGEEDNKNGNREAQDGGYRRETIYCVEAADGVLWAYDWGKDKWVAVMASERLKGVLQLTAGGAGVGAKKKLCAVLGGGSGVAVIDVAKGRMWEVRPPDGRLVIGVHVLPRMSRPEWTDDNDEQREG